MKESIVMSREQCTTRKHDASYARTIMSHGRPPLGEPRYWDLRIKLLGIRDPDNDLLNY
jgi:hypothetical protein